jgi:methylmalonyl-CoA/ethylmalonyl-CoA epimerase
LLVRDLDQAVERYRSVLGVESFEFGDLPDRGVRTARFKAGETWLVLVQPTDPQNIPGRHLAEHGEGLFLLSLAVESLDSAIETVTARGGEFTSDKPRHGLDDWQVIDLDSRQFFGAQIQLCNASDSSSDSKQMHSPRGVEKDRG